MSNTHLWIGIGDADPVLENGLPSRLPARRRNNRRIITRSSGVLLLREVDVFRLQHLLPVAVIAKVDAESGAASTEPDARNAIPPLERGRLGSPASGRRPVRFADSRLDHR